MKFDKGFEHGRFFIAWIISDAWDELFHQYDIDPDNVEISVECIGESE